ncbi:MAG: hypothetical protein ACR2LJ_10985 [Acidimicrobiales bacterium]
MLGVFGNVRAFDTQFKAGFGAATFSTGSLASVGEFYRKNSDAVDRHCVPTLDFDTGEARSGIDRRILRAHPINATHESGVGQLKVLPWGLDR